MPIYEYLCQDCGTKFEKLVRRSADAPETECPSCGQKHLRESVCYGKLCSYSEV